MRRAAVNGVTFAGFALGVAGLVWYPPLLLAGCAFDVLDGYLARRLDVASDAGARFDWTADVLLVGAAFDRVPLIVWAAIATLTLACSYYGARVSGRFALALGLTAIWGLS